MFLDQYPDTLKDARLQNHPLISKEKLTKEVQMLQDKLNGVPSPIVFTHNDLLLANIVIDGDKVSFIDYEYGDYNYQVYLSCQHICLKNRESLIIFNLTIFDNKKKTVKFCLRSIWRFLAKKNSWKFVIIIPDNYSLHIRSQ